MGAAPRRRQAAERPVARQLNIRLLRQADRDIREILRYRAEHAGEAAADKLQSDIENALTLLSSNPSIGSRRPNLTRRKYRFRLVFPCWIIYRTHPFGHELLVAHVIDARRDVARLLR
jgi:plasmid stabilization system protein ParE